MKLLTRSPLITFAIACTGVVIAAVTTPMQDPLRPGALLGQHAVDERGMILTTDGVVLAQTIKMPGDNERRYPVGALTAAVTGFISPFLGADGAEAAFDDLLSGNDPRLLLDGYTDLSSRSPRTADVVLTIDSGLQRVAATALGDHRGGVVLLDVADGAVRALYSNPSYDPNAIASHDYDGAVTAKTAAAAALVNDVYRTRAFPGSTGKLVTTLAALTSGAVEPSSFFDSEQEWLAPGGTTPVHNYEGSWCGGTFTDVFAHSCNIPFARLAVAAGAEQMAAAAEQLGFGEAVPFDLPEVASSAFPAAEELTPDLLARVGFGAFDEQITPLHLAVIAAAIANAGVAMRPHVLDRYIDNVSGRQANVAPIVWKRMMTAERAAIMADLMRSVTAYGTARQALDLSCGVSVAAKTGTGAFTPDEDHRELWVTGFAPAEDPQVAFAVHVADSADVREGTGATVAGPVARAVLEAALCGSGSTS